MQREPETEKFFSVRVEEDLPPAPQPAAQEAQRADRAQRQHLPIVEVVEVSEQPSLAPQALGHPVSHALADREVGEEIRSHTVVEERELGVDLEGVGLVAIGVDLRAALVVEVHLDEGLLIPGG